MKYWNKETEEKIIEFQQSINKDVFINYVYPALLNVSKGLMKKYQFKSKIFTEDELVHTVISDVVLSGDIWKYNKNKNNSNSLNYFTTCIKNKFLDIIRKETNNKREYLRLSLDKLIENGFDISDEYEVWNSDNNQEELEELSFGDRAKEYEEENKDNNIKVIFDKRNLS